MSCGHDGRPASECCRSKSFSMVISTTLPFSRAISSSRSSHSRFFSAASAASRTRSRRPTRALPSRSAPVPPAPADRPAGMVHRLQRPLCREASRPPAGSLPSASRGALRRAHFVLPFPFIRLCHSAVLLPQTNVSTSPAAHPPFACQPAIKRVCTRCDRPSMAETLGPSRPSSSK
jgi:hypothetical protein